ncbi:MAG: DHHA1 domain-containing protein [Chthoniobacter sp.]
MQIGGPRRKARWLLDGTLRGHAYPGHGRDRTLPDQCRERHRRRGAPASKPSPASTPTTLANADTQRLHALATKIGTPLPELEKRIDGLLAQQKELEKALKAAQQREAAGRAKDLLASAETINGTPAIVANLGAADGDTLQTVADALKSHGFKGVVVVAGVSDPGHSVALVSTVSPEFTAKFQAGKIIQAIAPIVGGKGGGKPEGARGGGKDSTKLDEALARAKTLLS